MDPIKRNFTFGDGVTHDASVSEASQPLTSCFNYKWNVTPNPQSITGATPDYTIEVSEDGVNWFEYDPGSTGVSVDDAVDDDHLAFTQMRINYDGTGTSGGTVEFLLTQKPH